MRKTLVCEDGGSIDFDTTEAPGTVQIVVRVTGAHIAVHVDAKKLADCVGLPPGAPPAPTNPPPLNPAGHLRRAREHLGYDGKKGSRALALTATKIDEALMWLTCYQGEG